QAVEISNSLKKIKELIDSSRDSSVQAQEQFDAMAALINAVKTEELDIKNAMETQNVGGSQVLESLNGINGLISSIKEASSALLVSGQAVIEDINSLKTM
ncbi:MAG: chemotaxis protein, partial [Treponema sp.]|nr:chemotaxis protein [Treponema sp.]